MSLLLASILALAVDTAHPPLRRYHLFRPDLLYYPCPYDVVYA